MKGILKRNWLRVSFGSLIFILLFCAALSLVRPILSKISAQIRKVEEGIALSLQEKTGLSVSYGSLSPSILSAININDVAVFDIGTRREIVRIKKVSVSYRLIELFSRNALKAVKNVTVSGVKIEFDAAKDAETIVRLKHLLSDRDVHAGENFSVSALSQNHEGEAILDQADLELLSKTDFHLPFDVFIKNLSLHYVDSSSDLLLSLSQGTLREPPRSRGISLDFLGKFYFTNAAVTKDKKRLVFSCAFTAGGSVLPGIDGSSVTVKLSENRSADFSVSHLDFLVGYEAKTVSLKSFKSIVPLSINASLSLESLSGGLLAEFKDLNPFDLVSVREKSGLLEKIAGTTVTGGLSLSQKDGKFSYSVDVSSVLGEELLDGPCAARLSCSGGEASVLVEQLLVDSQMVSAEFTGSIDIKKKIPSGVLSLGHLVLKNGCTVSSEVYVEPHENGVFCFSPNIFVGSTRTAGEIALTAFSLTALPSRDSVDFSVEFNDYSHADYGSSCHFEIDGSYVMGKKPFVQASVAVSDFFVENALKAASILRPDNGGESFASAKKFLEPFIFSGNLYVSTDFHDITYNSMDCVLANTNDYDQILLFSVNGSREMLQLNQFDLHLAGQLVQATAAFDFSSGYSDFSFTTDFVCNSIPYSFSGIYTGDFLSVSGDYDFNTIVMRDKKAGSYSASVSFSALPLPVGNKVYSFTTFSTASGKTADDFSVVVNSLEFEELSEKISFAPRFTVSGTGTKSGFVADSIVYSDVVSALEGSGRIDVNVPLGVFESVHAEISMRNASSAETIFLSADVANDHHLPFSLDALKTKFALSGEVTANDVPVARFLKKQDSADKVTGQIVVSGTVSNPFVTLSLEKMNVMLGGKECFAQANVIYDETGLNIYDRTARWAAFSVSGVSAFLDPKTFAGNMDATVDFSFGDKKARMPLHLDLSGIAESERLSVPEFLTVNISSPGISGDFMPNPVPFDLIAMKLPNGFEFFTQKTNIFHAAVSQAGNVSVQVERNEVLSFDLNGSFRGKNMDVTISNIAGNLGKISKSVKIPYVDFYSGDVSGNVRVSGTNDDPDFSGSLCVKNSEFKVPMVSSSSIKVPAVDFVAESGGVFVQKTAFTVGKGILDLSAQIELLGWSFGDMNVRLDTRAKKPIPIDMKFPLVGYKGYAGLALDLTFNVPDFIVYLKGDVYGERGDVDLVVSNFQSGITTIAFASFLTEEQPVQKSGRKPECVVDVTIHAGQKFSLFFNPIMRAVISPKTEIALMLDSASGDVAHKGDLELRGGEIMWLNRNFYLREGKIKCNETNSSIDPIVTVRAETKERDDTGNRVTLTLSAVNQPLSKFKPSFSASPAKSEAEIMELLGQAFSGDASEATDVIASGGDFFVQTLVI